MKRIIKYFVVILGFALVFVLASCDPKLYTVKFELNGGSPQIEDKQFRIGDKLEEPITPTKEGYTFNGWYIDKNFNTKLVAGQKIGKDMTIYAQWLINSYNINYVTNGGSPIETERHEFNSTISAPENPTKRGYVFDKWYLDSELTEEFEFTTMPSRNITLYAGWVPEKIEVKFVSADVEIINLRQLVDYLGKVTAPENPTRPGYTFSGWYLDGELYDFDRPVTRSIQLKAHWNINQYTVSYDTGGGSEIPNSVYAYNAPLNQPQNPTRNGYRFVGWLLNGENFIFTDKKMPANDLQLVAKWSANNYTVAFNKNHAEATGTIESISATYDQEFTAPSSLGFEISGYTFANWNTKADGTGTSYNVGDLVINLTATHLDTTELFAIWVPNDYQIIFDPAGGLGEMANVPCLYDEVITLPNNLFTKQGYLFAGWNLDGIIYKNGAQVSKLTTGESVTLVATWNPIEYKVVFNANGGSGSMNVQTFTYDLEQGLSSNEFTKEGNSFAGWALTETGEVEYTNNEEVINLTSENNGIITLYAKWEKNSYVFTINYNDGVTPNKVLNYLFDESIALEPNPEVEGKVFMGWYINGTSNEFFFTNAKMPAHDLDIIARYENEIYIIFDSKGGSNVNDISGVAGVPVTPPQDPTKLGNTFAGWFEQGATVPYEFTVMPAETLYLEARWTVNKYNVTYHTNGGNEILPESLDYNSKLTKVPIKEGYIFLGWFNLELITQITNVPAHDVSVYAKWMAISYSIVFDSNGGSGSTQSHSNVKYDQQVKLNSNTFTKTGYLFSGWALTPEGVVTYDNNQSVSNITSNNEEVVTLYAKWTPITYTVIFDGNGADGGSVANMVVTYDQIYAPPANNYTKEGYTFLAWAKSKTGVDEVTQICNLTTTNNGQVTLYAKWLINRYDVTFNYDGKTHTTRVDHGTILSAVEKPQVAKVGHSFVAWLKAGNAIDPTTEVIVSNLVLEAEYSVNEYDVVFLIDGVPTYQIRLKYGAALSFDDYVTLLHDEYLFVKDAKNKTQDLLDYLLNNGTSGNISLYEFLTEEANLTRLQGISPASYELAMILLRTPRENGGDVWVAANNLHSVLIEVYNDASARYYIYANNNNEPVKEGFIFGGWILGDSTVYEGLSAGNNFTGFAPAAEVLNEQAKIVAKWIGLSPIENIVINNADPNRIDWDAPDTSQIALGEGQTIEIEYEIYSILTDENILLDTVVGDNFYRFLTDTTWSVPGTYQLKIIARLTIKEGSALITELESEFADVAFEYTVQISGNDLEVESEGDFYYRGTEPGSTYDVWYFYTEYTYNFSATNEFELVDENGNPAPSDMYSSIVSLESSNGGTNNTIRTTENTGAFYFKRQNTVYYAKVLPYLSAFHFGEDLTHFKTTKQGGSTLFLNATDELYQIGRKNNTLLKSANLANYDQNGFKFDLTVRTTGGNKVNYLNYQDFMQYTFYKYNEVSSLYEPISNAEMGIYDTATGAWLFEAPVGRYKVEINIKSIYVAKALKPIIKPLVLEFVLNDGANVFTHDVLKNVFAYTEFNTGLNIHGNITPVITDVQRYTNAAAAATNPFLRFSKVPNLRDGSLINVSPSELLEHTTQAKLSGNVYVRVSNHDLDEDYFINGNLFTIDASKYPYSSTGSKGNLSSVGSGVYQIADQHSAIFHYISTNLTTKTSESTLLINNLNLKGNTRTSILDSSSQAELQNSIELMNRNSGGLLGVYVPYGTKTNVYNTVITNTTLALKIHGGNGDVNLDYLYTEASWSNSIYARNEGVLTISNSYMKDSGGAAIHMFDDSSTNTNKTTQKLIVDEATVIDNFVSGEEGYFKAYAMEFSVITLKAQLEQGVSPDGLTVITNVIDPITGLSSEKVNFKYLFTPIGDNLNSATGSQKAQTDLVLKGYAYNVDNSTEMPMVWKSQTDGTIILAENLPGMGRALMACGIYPK